MSLPALTLKGLLTSDNFGDFVHVGSDICKGAEVAADDFLGGEIGRASCRERVSS